MHNVQRAYSSPIAAATTDSQNYQEISAREEKKQNEKQGKNETENQYRYKRDRLVSRNSSGNGIFF